jgi:hypothetical protein
MMCLRDRRSMAVPSRFNLAAPDFGVRDLMKLERPCAKLT